MDDARYAIPLSRVLEIAPRVRVTHLAGTSSPVAGLVRHRGEIAVAVDLRARLGHPHRAWSLEDHFVLARTERRRVALIVDRVLGTRALDGALVRPVPVASQHVRGVVALPDGILLLHDLDAVLSLDEEATIDEAMKGIA